MRAKQITRLFIYSLIAITATACDSGGGGGGGGGGDANDYNNPLSIGTAPATYNGSVDGYPTTLGENFITVDIAAGGQYNITLSNFTTNLDLHVFNKPFTDQNIVMLCQSLTLSPVETCTVTDVDTATLTKLYINVSNYDDATSNYTLTVN